MAQIAPSILAADFARLGEDVSDVCRIGIDYLHIDVMDGVFVPNISFGSGVMKSLLGIATVPFDVHLMIEKPDRYIEDFVTDNTEFITVHEEACEDVSATVDHIHSLGIKAGVSIKPGTDVSVLDGILDKVDMILVMSVEPGFGGQKFNPVALDKIRVLDGLRKSEGYTYAIEIDGGVGTGNAGIIVDAGCDIMVAGTSVFKAADRETSIKAIRNPN